MASSLNHSRVLTALAAAVSTALASVVLVAPPAQAAWQGFARVHGGVAQACTVPVRSGFQVRVRVDNRRSTHAHVGALQAPDGRQRLLRAEAGRLSGVRSLVVRRSARVVVGLGETTGTGASADERRASRTSRC